MMDKLKNLCFD